MTDSSTHGMFNVRTYGAVGDGKTDDTAAIQRAIDDAAKVQGSVWFPPGCYACGTIQMRSHTALVGQPTWCYHGVGGVSLKLCDPNAKALISLTGTIGARVVGMSLDGGKLGEGVCGIYLNGEGHKSEETLVIDNTRVAHFTGDAVTLHNVWGYTVRNSMFIFNGGNGLTVTHWDGWILNNIFNNNAGYGISFDGHNAAATVIGNRIEWNHSGGVYFHVGGHYQLNDNYIDRSGGPGIFIDGKPDARACAFSITGNVIYRSGARISMDDPSNCHVRVRHVHGLVMTGNTMHVGGNDSGGGQRSPAVAMRLEGLSESIVKDNAMTHAAMRELIVDEGGHDDQAIIRDNVGSIAPPPEDPPVA